MVKKLGGFDTKPSKFEEKTVEILDKLSENWVFRWTIIEGLLISYTFALKTFIFCSKNIKLVSPDHQNYIFFTRKRLKDNFKLVFITKNFEKTLGPRIRNAFSYADGIKNKEMFFVVLDNNVYFSWTNKKEADEYTFLGELG